jgi:hypothetical protein
LYKNQTQVTPYRHTATNAVIFPEDAFDHSNLTMTVDHAQKVAVYIKTFNIETLTHDGKVNHIA